MATPRESKEVSEASPPESHRGWGWLGGRQVRAQAGEGEGGVPLSPPARPYVTGPSPARAAVIGGERARAPAARPPAAPSRPPVDREASGACKLEHEGAGAGRLRPSEAGGRSLTPCFGCHPRPMSRVVESRPNAVPTGPFPRARRQNPLAEAPTAPRAERSSLEDARFRARPDSHPDGLGGLHGGSRV